MITQQEKSQIKALLQDPRWPTIQRVIEQVISETQDTFVVKDDQWETLKATITREAKVQGIRELLNRLYQEAS